MKKYTSQILLVSTCSLIGLLCFNCAGEKNVKFTPDLPKDIPPEIIFKPSIEVIESIPSWYTDPPVNEGFRNQIATAVSTESEIAMKNAEYYASQYLENALQSELIMELNSALVQAGKRENSFIGKALKRSGNKIISRHTDNYIVVKEEIQKENTDIGYIYRAYILIEWDAGPAQEELLHKLKEHDKVYAMMGTTELLKKMETAVDTYINREKDRGLASASEKETSTSSTNNVINEVACANNCLKRSWWKFWAKKTVCTCAISTESNDGS